MKKCLLLNFSPNITGVSSKISTQILNSLKKYAKVKLINVNQLKIQPCHGCVQYCYKYGKCRLKDDMEILYDHFEHDDFFIFVTPVYFYHIPGYAKLMIDRCQPYWVRKYILKNLTLPERKSSLICIGATKGEQLFSGINLTMKYFFDIFNFEFDLQNNLYLRNVEKISDLRKHKQEIKKYLVKLQNLIKIY